MHFTGPVSDVWMYVFECVCMNACMFECIYVFERVCLNVCVLSIVCNVFIYFVYLCAYSYLRATISTNFYLSLVHSNIFECFEIGSVKCISLTCLVNYLINIFFTPRSLFILTNNLTLGDIAGVSIISSICSLYRKPLIKSSFKKFYKYQFNIKDLKPLLFPSSARHHILQSFHSMYHIYEENNPIEKLFFRQFHINRKSMAWNLI